MISDRMGRMQLTKQKFLALCDYSNSGGCNNNNNNNNHDNVYGAVIIAQSHYESSSGSHDECGTAPSGR